MDGWFWVLFWWLAFALSHLLLSHGAIRAGLVERLGKGPFLGLYSLLALAAFVPLVIVYFSHRHDGPLLWNLRPYPAIEGLAAALAAVAWTVIVAAYWQPSPVGLLPGAKDTARGLSRITRHGLFMGIALWGLSHLLLNGFLSDVIFFGGFVAFAFIGAAHQDARLRAERAAFYAQTSLLPFAAILSGRNRWVGEELPWPGLALGFAVAVVLYMAHPWLFA